MRPLEDILIVDLSQFLSGPSASLRLADLGARVIKVERPVVGDLCRQLYISNTELDGESTVFHAINRNKESFEADLKDDGDRQKVFGLIKQADVVIHNFRPGVIERLGLGYEKVIQINPSIIYGEISGYGKEGPWKDKPGQDLLLQALTGLTWLSGNRDNGPVPMGLAIVDIMAGIHLAQGILACLVRKGITGKGGKVEVSMMESSIDFQFELITTYFNDGGRPTVRSGKNNAHAYLGAPYGIYKTQDGYLALAMGSIPLLGEILGCEELLEYQNASAWFEERDGIRSIISRHLSEKPTHYWLTKLEPHDYWCSDVLDWERLFRHEAFMELDMIQKVGSKSGLTYETTRCPIRFDSQILKSIKGSPRLGEHTRNIIDEFKLEQNA